MPDLSLTSTHRQRGCQHSPVGLTLGQWRRPTYGQTRQGQHSSSGQRNCGPAALYQQRCITPPTHRASCPQWGTAPLPGPRGHLWGQCRALCRRVPVCQGTTTTSWSLTESLTDGQLTQVHKNILHIIVINKKLSTCFHCHNL